MYLVVFSFILTKFCFEAACSECFIILMPLRMFVGRIIVSLINGHCAL